MHLPCQELCRAHRAVFILLFECYRKTSCKGEAMHQSSVSNRGQRLAAHSSWPDLMRVQHFLLTNAILWRKINYREIGIEMVLPVRTRDNLTDYLIKLRKTTERQGAVSYLQIPGYCVCPETVSPLVTRSLQTKSG